MSTVSNTHVPPVVCVFGCSAVSNPEIFREVMQMARDPEVMERAKVSTERTAAFCVWSMSACPSSRMIIPVTGSWFASPLLLQAMMQDPQFKAEADKFLNSDAMQKAMEQSLKVGRERGGDGAWGGQGL